MLRKITLCVTGIVISFSLMSQSPGSVSSDLKLWLKANAGVTGSSPVSGWVDQSGQGNNATVVSNGPDLLSNQINFNSALDFTRTNSEYLQVTGGLFGSSALSDVWVYYVSQPTATNQRTTIFFEALLGTNEYFTGLNAWENGNAFLDFGSTASGGRLTGNAGTASGVYNIWTMGSSSTTATPNGTNKSIYRDGLAVLSSNANDATITGNNRDFYIGGRYREINGNYFDGQIAELIIYEGVPSPLDQEKVQSYLAVKYGISKISEDNTSTVAEDERDYFDSNGAVIWDYSAFSTYSNNITGIGRDDSSDLDQRKSKSNNANGAVTMDKGGAFGTDRDFLLWGDNGEVATSIDVPTGFNVRSERVWRVDLSGSPGSVSFSIDLSAAGIQNTGDVADYALIIDADGIFNTGASVHTNGAALVGNELSFTNVSFSDGDFFTIAIDNFVSPLAPGNVSDDLRLWLRADLGISGASPVTNWADQSGLNNNAVLIANGPDAQSAAINFNPALGFDRANSEYLQVTNGILGSRSYDNAWVYYVSKPNAVNQRTTIFFEELSGSLEYFGSLNAWENGNAFFDFGGSGTGGRITGNAGTLAGTYNLWTAGSSKTTSTPGGTNKVISRDGLEVLTSNASDATITGSNQNFFIGGRYQETDGNYYDGEIAELIVYNGIPTALEQEKVQSYLTLKYGISKASADNTATVGQDERDYFSSDGTVIWDASANSSYHNMVTGIGRDDLSALEQKQSRNTNSASIVTIGLDDDLTPDGLETTNTTNDGTFGSDKTFLIWGHDNACLECTEAKDNDEFDESLVDSRLNREWKVQETGSTGTLTLEFDLSAIPGPSGIGTNDDDQVLLLVDADGDFSSGASIVLQSFVTSGDDKAVFRVDLTNGVFFTLASGEVSALSVSLLSFSAIAQNGQVVLKWSTVEEEGNSFFLIERATKDLNFELVARVDGAGSTQGIQKYSYHDLSPGPGKNYYRLIDVDINGRKNTSSIVSVDVSQDMTTAVSVYPNPLSNGDELNLTLRGFGSQALVKVYSSAGNLWLQKTLEMAEGERDFVLDTSRLKPGHYVVQLISETGQVFRKKLMIR